MSNTYSFDNIGSQHVSLFNEYGNKRLEFVNSRIMNIENFLELIGGEKNIQAMVDNHRNHIAFMSIVFRLKDPVLLENTLPWVYRAYRNQGFSYDYFIKELNLWKESIVEVFEEPFASDFIAIYDKMCEEHDNNIKKSKEKSSLDFLHSLNDVQKEFINILLEGNMRKLVSISDEYLNGNKKVEDYYSKMITPVMYAIGQLWEMGEITAATEHLASSLITRILASYNIKQELPAITKGKIVITSAANEYHEIGAWMTANLFEMDGWQVYYLGANTPIKDVIKIVEDVSPDILGVSVTMVYNLENIRTLFEHLRSNPKYDNMKLYAGGSLFSFYPQVSQFLKADFIAKSFTESLNQANQFWSEKH